MTPDWATPARSWVRSQPAGRIRLLGLVGSGLVAVSGLLIGHLAPTRHVHALLALQATTHARTVGFTLAFTGLGVLTLAWLALGEQVRGTAGGARLVGLTALLWSAPLLVAPPMFSDDVWSYVAEGDLVAQGRSPYVETPLSLDGPILHAVNASWRDVHAPYGPLSLMWGGAVSRISANPWFGLLGFRVLALAGLVALVLTVPRIARKAGRDPALASWLAVASPFTLAQGISGTHLDLVIAGLLCLALARAVRGGWVSAALLVGAATAVKAPAVALDVAVALVSLPAVPRQRWWPRVRRTAEVVGISAVPVLGLGLVSGLGTGWVGGLLTPLRHKTPLSLSTQVGMRLGQLLDERLVPPLHVVGTLLLGVVLLLVLLRGTSGSPRKAVLVAAVVTSATVLLSPVVHYWYFFWCLPFLASASLSPSWRRASLVMTLVLGLLAPVDLSRGHVPFSGTIMLLGVGGALLSALDPRQVRRALRRSASAGSSRPGA